MDPGSPLRGVQDDELTTDIRAHISRIPLHNVVGLHTWPALFTKLLLRRPNDTPGFQHYVSDSVSARQSARRHTLGNRIRDPATHLLLPCGFDGAAVPGLCTIT